MVARSETFGGSLDDLRAFCAVIDFRTITAAAASLRETKGSVSRRISRLEGALGATLLARHPRAVSPTADGLAFYARARECLMLLDEAAEIARDARTVPSGHLRVTTSVDFGVEVMPEIVTSFRSQFPQITMEMLNTDAQLDLAANRIDLALRLGGDERETGYRASLLCKLSIGLYAAPAYLDRRGPILQVAELAQHDVVLSRERFGPAPIALTDGVRTEQVVLSPAIRASDFATVLRLTIAGAGIGHVPTLVAAHAMKNRTLVRVLPTWTSEGGTLRAVSLAGRELPARVRLFREHVRDALESRFAMERDPR